MRAFKFILAGGAGLAALAAAAPASAQYYPGYGGGGNVVGQVLGQILGGGQGGYGGYGYNGYGQNSQAMVQRCAAAVTDRINRQSGAGYGGSYGGYGGYGQGYAQGGARVVAITSVERRSSGRLRVRGMVQTNAYGAGYGGYGGYGQGGYGGYGQGGYGGQGDLAFKCNIDYRGYISDIDLDRVNNAYSSGYNNGYSPYGSYRRY